MAFKEFCSECDKPLTGQPLIHIPQMTIRTRSDKVGTLSAGRADNLHFCDVGCLRSFVVKNTDRPSLITPNGPAQ